MGDLESLLDLNSLLEWVGAESINNPKDADIDLSMKTLTKDALVGLLTGE